MKVRSQTELQEILDSSLAARKRELTTLKFVVDMATRQHERDALLRAAVPIVYAHWEGFVKLAAVAYLEYVSRQPGKLKDFATNIVAVAIRGELFAAGVAKKTSVHSAFLARHARMLEEPVAFDAESAISANSNLNSDVLREIMETIGVAFDRYWQAKSLLIDHKLLKTRNDVAHGDLVAVDVPLYEELHAFVIEGLNRFKTAVENAAATGQHRATP